MLEFSITEYEFDLQSKFDEYYEGVEAVMMDVFTNVVEPFIKSRNWQFMAGNGTYYVCNEKGEDVEFDDDDEEWVEVRRFLDIEIPGDDGNSLGTIMPPCNKK